ncbi:MAG: polyribonucleotide nucleotidyltransferase [Elusimicrobiota bacterium]
MQRIKEKIEVNGRTLEIETGQLARQAQGAVKVSYGETVILATCCTDEARPGLNFFPLTVDYRERTYAAGKIPGGFFKREGRPQEKETITSRLIDRPLRPLFPDGYKKEVQVMVTVLSSDGENDADIPALIGASCATALTPAPFAGPVGAVRISSKDGNMIVNPTVTQLQESDCDFVVAGTSDAVVMLEGEANEVPEEEVIKSIEKAFSEIKRIVELQNTLLQKANPEKEEFVAPQSDEELENKVKEAAEEKITSLFKTATSKIERSRSLSKIKEEVLQELVDEESEDASDVKGAISEYFGQLKKEILRKLIKEEGLRVDGRKPDELRPIDCVSSLLPRTHGSGLFTKGETQALAAVTLGTMADMQIMDELSGEYKKSFMLHYNFPAFSVGEVKPNRGPGRREIGHGLLAEKALKKVFPSRDDFPYTIRVVSDILESNGSSSMASICAGTIALMDAGVKIESPVAGVGMGIIEGVILTDMLGDEDHAGDMDFKVAGTQKGVTAIQMDIKIEGISTQVLRDALNKAREARLKTLEAIQKEIAQPREELSPHAPGITIIKINPEKIGSLIGPGGKNIKKIQEDTGASIDIEDDGSVSISADNEEAMAETVKRVKGHTDEAKPGQIYIGTVKNIMNFGAFVEILPGQDGLVHISELAPYHVSQVTDVLNEGDEVRVKCIEIDERGRINLSRVQAMSEEEKEKEKNNK